MNSNVTHKITNDGLTLISTYKTTNGGTAETKISWDNEEKALANYNNAMNAFELRIPYFDSMTVEPDYSSKSKLRKVGPFNLYMNVGSPTWWMPRVSVTKEHIRFGWLRAAFSIDWKK